MEDIKKKVVIPFIIFLGFIVVSVNSLYKGIVNHEPWRIVLASAGGLVSIGFIALIIYTVVKSSKKAV
jgi:hypothetical protein